MKTHKAIKKLQKKQFYRIQIIGEDIFLETDSLRPEEFDWYFEKFNKHYTLSSTISNHLVICLKKKKKK